MADGLGRLAERFGIVAEFVRDAGHANADAVHGCFVEIFARDEPRGRGVAKVEADELDRPEPFAELHFIIEIAQRHIFRESDFTCELRPGRGDFRFREIRDGILHGGKNAIEQCVECCLAP